MQKVGPKVVAVIPTLGNNESRLTALIDSIKKYSGAYNLKIVLVDNSADGILSKLASVDEVIWTGINLGWVGSIEYVRRSQEFDYLWTVQDDMTLLNDVLGILLNEFSENSSLGVASPVLVRDGLIPAKTRGGIFVNEEKLEWVNIPEVGIEPEFFETDVELCFVSGSGALWSRQALEEISGFDLDLYPLMHVDVDACFRLRASNWKLKLLPTAHISHEIGGSTPSILGVTLLPINEKIIKDKLLNSKNTNLRYGNELDHDFLFSIAKKSSFLFLSTSNHAKSVLRDLDSQMVELHQQIAELHQQVNNSEVNLQNVYNSRTWKLTSLFRFLAKFFK
jgi:GT2 family glycosyltransferase